MGASTYRSTQRFTLQRLGITRREWGGAGGHIRVLGVDQMKQAHGQTASLMIDIGKSGVLPSAPPAAIITAEAVADDLQAPPADDLSQHTAPALQPTPQPPAALLAPLPQVQPSEEGCVVAMKWQPPMWDLNSDSDESEWVCAAAQPQDAGWQEAGPLEVEASGSHLAVPERRSAAIVETEAAANAPPTEMVSSVVRKRKATNEECH